LSFLAVQVWKGTSVKRVTLQRCIRLKATSLTFGGLSDIIAGAIDLMPHLLPEQPQEGGKLVWAGLAGGRREGGWGLPMVAAIVLVCAPVDLGATLGAVEILQRPVKAPSQSQYGL
jgi:hypothetical protein